MISKKYLIYKRQLLWSYNKMWHNYITSNIKNGYKTLTWTAWNAKRNVYRESAVMSQNGSSCHYPLHGLWGPWKNIPHWWVQSGLASGHKHTFEKKTLSPEFNFWFRFQIGIILAILSISFIVRHCCCCS